MYNEIDRDDNLLEDESGLWIAQGYGKPLLGIERFVSEALSSSEPPFSPCVNHLRKSVMVPSSLAKKYMPSFNAFINAYEDHYEYSEHVQLFYSVCFSMHLDYGVFQGKSVLHEVLPGDVPELFNRFVAEIRAQGRTIEFKRKVNARQHNARRNFSSSAKYIEELYSKYSRLLVLRVDLGYKKGIADDVTVDLAHLHRKKMLNNMRSNRIFENLVGYIWKLEYGESKGLHFHVVLFYDGARVKKDAYLAELIGRYWVDQITRGSGTFYNCNRSKAKYKNCGIGMISHFDAEKREFLLFAVRYLTKKDQYLRLKSRGRTRIFGRGELPKQRIGGAGRPRKQLPML